jgi:hypothetical protein
MMRNPEVQIGNSGQDPAHSAAVPLLEKAVKAVPSNRTYRYHLGLTCQKLQNPSRAKAELEKAIPNHLSQIKHARPLGRTL